MGRLSGSVIGELGMGAGAHCSGSSGGSLSVQVRASGEGRRHAGGKGTAKRNF